MLQVNEDGFPWLELLIGLLTLSLLFQLWPSLFWGLLRVVDVRMWSWPVIIGVHLAVILALVYTKSYQDAKR